MHLARGSNSSQIFFLFDLSNHSFLQWCRASVQYSPSTSFMSAGHAPEGCLSGEATGAAPPSAAPGAAPPSAGLPASIAAAPALSPSGGVTGEAVAAGGCGGGSCGGSGEAPAQDA